MPRYAILELTDSEAKLLLASKQRKTPLIIDSVQSVDLSEFPKDEDGLQKRLERIRETFSRPRFGGIHAGLILPKQQAIVRTVQLPSVDPTEIAGMASFEAEKFIPFNAERHIVGHAVLRSEGEAGSHVLLAAVDSPVMEAALASAKAAGVEPQVAEVSSLSVSRAFMRHHPAAPTLKEGTSTLVLNISRTMADVSIIRDGMLEAARSQPISLAKLEEESRLSGEHWMQVEVQSSTMQEWIVRLMRFVRQTIEFAQREHNVPAPSIAFLCGEGAQTEGLAAAISTSLGISVQLFNPADKFQLAPGIESGKLFGFVSCLGLLDRLVEEEANPGEQGTRLNLLPPAVLEQQAASERRVLLAISATMVFITLVLVYFAWNSQAAHRQQLAQLYSRYNRDMRTVVDDIELKKERLDIIASLKTQQASPLAVLDQITAYPGIGPTHKQGRLTLTNFKYSQSGEVIIGGMALDLEDVSGFADYLQKLTWETNPVFSEVGIPQNQPTDALGRNRPKVWTFSVTCKLYTPGSGSNDEDSE